MLIGTTKRFLFLVLLNLGMNVGHTETGQATVITELLQMNIEENVEHTNELGRNEAKDEQEETLTVGYLKECRL